MPNTPPDVVLIAKAVLQLARRLRAERPSPSVTLSALGLLARLHQQGPMPATAPARAERLKPQSLSRLIARLDADDLIERQPDPIDRRALVIAITLRGRRAPGSTCGSTRTRLRRRSLLPWARRT